MKLSKSFTLLQAAVVTSVLGHGQVHWFITEDATYAAADAYAELPDPTSPLRKLNTYAPAAPFTGPDITCGVSLNFPQHATLNRLRCNSLVEMFPPMLQFLSEQAVLSPLIGDHGLQCKLSVVKSVSDANVSFRHPGTALLIFPSVNSYLTLR